MWFQRKVISPGTGFDSLRALTLISKNRSFKVTSLSHICLTGLSRCLDVLILFWISWVILGVLQDRVELGKQLTCSQRRANTVMLGVFIDRMEFDLGEVGNILCLRAITSLICAKVLV